MSVFFFDIDGTIWTYKNEIPESTVRAIHLLNRLGHKTFLCTGRCRSFIQDPRLLSIGFSGIISGCGTMIEYGDETLFYHQIPLDLAEWTVTTIRNYGFKPILEGKRFCYLDEEDFVGNYYAAKVKEEMGENLRSIRGDWGKWEFSKLSCDTEFGRREECFRALEHDYDFLIHSKEVAEIVPKGFDKASGIIHVCNIFDINPSDAFAFGDGMNDIKMLKLVGNSVAMGDAVEAAKEAASYVTTPLLEDGIWNACVHFNLFQ